VFALVSCFFFVGTYFEVKNVIEILLPGEGKEKQKQNENE
jgi:hypothetical protein